MTYLHYQNLNLNVSELEETCNEMEPFILRNFKDGDYNGVAAETTKLYSQYNFLLYPLPQVHELYEGIRKTFRSIVPDHPHFIQCWLNVYNKEDYIDWHHHWEAEANVWHGYYTVRGEGSITSYRIPNTEQIDVVNKVDQLVLGPSAGDQHRTYPWDGEGKRITIAFDIVPAWNCFGAMNHWIPI